MTDTANITDNSTKSKNKTVELVTLFYKVHANLPIIKERRFNDIIGRVNTFDIDFTTSSKDNEPNQDQHFQAPKNANEFYSQLNEAYNIDDPEFITEILNYLSTSNHKISVNDKVEFCETLITSNFIRELLKLMISSIKSLRNLEKTYTIINGSVITLIYIIILKKKKTHISQRDLDAIIRIVCQVLLNDLNSPKKFLDIRRSVRLLRLAIECIFGGLMRSYIKKQRNCPPKSGRPIPFSDRDKIITNLIPQLEYRKKCLKYLKDIDAPYYVTHEKLATYTAIDDTTDLNALFDIIKMRKPLHVNIDDITNKLHLPFPKDLLNNKTKITHFFEHYILKTNSLMFLLKNVLKQFETEHSNEEILTKYKNFGFNYFDVLEENVLESYVNPDRGKSRCFNIMDDLVEDAQITDKIGYARFKHILCEIQRYRNTTANDISYIILIISKNLKINNGYQYLYFLEKLQDIKIFDILIQYIADFRSPENCHEFMKLDKIYKQSDLYSAELEKSMKKYIPLHGLILKSAIKVENNEKRQKMNLKAQKTNYFILKYINKLELIGNTMDLLCTQCKYSYYFSEYLKNHYKTFFYNLITDIKSQKLLYYIPKIHTYFISIPFSKNPLEFDRIFLRDQENYCVAVEHYQNLQNQELFPIITRYPTISNDPRTSNTISKSFKYDINNPILLHNIRIWESLYSICHKNLSPLNPEFFTDEYLSPMIRSRTESEE